MSYANKAKRHEYKNREQGGPMRQPHEREMTIYADIGEVRMEVRVSDCNQMLADGWLLLGAYPLTTVGDPAQRNPGGNRGRNSPRTPSSGCSVWLGMSWERDCNRRARELILCLSLLTSNIMADTAHGWQENTPFEGFRQTLSPPQRRAILSTLIPRFSVVAILSVGTLVITGLYSGWVQVTIVEAVATPYGLTLLAKLGLVGLLLFLGALNLLWVRPRLSREEGASRWLQRLLLGEAVLAVLVLLSVGMLSSLEPARQGASWLGIGQEDSLAFQDTIEGTAITLNVEPGQVGLNQFTVLLKDRSGQPITNATEVRLELTYLNTDLGTISIPASPTAPGEYTLEGQLLSLAGNWQAGLVVRRPDAFDTRTAFRFQVASGGASDSAAITPETDTGRLLWGVELALLGFLFIAVGIPMGGWWSRRGAVVMSSGLASFVVGLFLAFNTQLAGTGATDNLINPVPPTADSLEIGQRLYTENCQSCHGVAGRGDGPQAAGLNPPPLDLVVHVPLHPDGALFGFIQNGIPGTAMPAWGNKLTNEEIWHIVNYIRTFEEVRR
jgi:copper transport protein